MSRISLASILPTAVIGVVIVGSVLLILHDPESHSVKGTVTGPDGAPVAECNITVIRGGGEAVTLVDQTTSGPKGRFSVDVELPDTSYWLWAIAQKPGFGLDWVRFDRAHHLKLSLRGSFATCRGTITDPEGRPIDGAVVSATGLRHNIKDGVFLKGTEILSDRSDERGRFSIPGLPPEGRALLRIMAEGRETVSLKVPLSADGSELDLPLRRDVTIEGRVVFRGRPVSNMRVKILNEHGHCRKASRTDDDGWYRFDNVSPDPIYVDFGLQGAVAASPAGPLSPQPGARLTLEDVEAYQCGYVSGMVRQADGGEGLRNWVLKARETSADRPPGLHKRTVTDHTGRYGLALGPGRWVIEVLVPGHVASADDEAPCRSVEVVGGKIIDDVDLSVDCASHQLHTAAVDIPRR